MLILNSRGLGNSSSTSERPQTQVGPQLIGHDSNSSKGDVFVDHVAAAKSQLGVRESTLAVPSNPEVTKYHIQGTGAREFWINGQKVPASDRTPWCASFVNWTLKQAGFRTSGSAQAGDFGKFPESFIPLDHPVVGAIAVVKNGAHATIVVGWDSDPKREGNFIGLGGNQGGPARGNNQGFGRVQYSSYADDKTTKYYLPKGYTESGEMPTINKGKANGDVSKN